MNFAAVPLIVFKRVLRTLTVIPVGLFLIVVGVYSGKEGCEEN